MMLFAKMYLNTAPHSGAIIAGYYGAGELRFFPAEEFFVLRQSPPVGVGTEADIASVSLDPYKYILGQLFRLDKGCDGTDDKRHTIGTILIQQP